MPPGAREGSRFIPREAGIRVRGATQDEEGNQILDPDAALLTPRASGDFVPVRGGRGARGTGISEEPPEPLPPSRLPRLTPRIRPRPGRPAPPPVELPEVLSLGVAPPIGEEPVEVGATVLDALETAIPDIEEATQDPGTGVMRIRHGRGRLAGMPTRGFDARGLAPGTTRLADGSLQVVDAEGNGVVIQPAFDEPEEAIEEIAELGGEDIEVSENGIVRARFGRVRIAGRPQMNIDEPEEGEPTEEPGISVAGQGADLFATLRFSNGRRQAFTPSAANPRGLRQLAERVLQGTVPQATNPAGDIILALADRFFGLRPSFFVQDAPEGAVPGVVAVDENTVLVTYEAEEVAEGEEAELIVQEFTILEEEVVDEIVADEAVAAELGLEEEVEEEAAEETPATEGTTTEETTPTTTEGAAPTTTEAAGGTTTTTETTTTTTGETTGTGTTAETGSTSTTTTSS